MARFYGTVQGERGRATRLGHRELDVSAQSYSGDVRVTMYIRPDDEFPQGVDYVQITVHPHAGQCGNVFCLYNGPIKTLLDSDARAARLQALGIEEFIRRHEEQT